MKNERKYLLIGGDLSGIQNYIYQIVSKYAAKNLKGRSFYVHLLGDAVKRVLLDRLGLSGDDVIYCSGGSFYILAPDTDSVRQKLPEVVAEIEDKVFDAHGMSLYVAIDAVPLDANDMQGPRLAAKWGELFDLRDRKKMHRMPRRLVESYSRFFEPQAVTTDKCDAITGQPFVQGESFCSVKGLGFVSELNSCQITLGKALRSCRCIAVTHSPNPDVAQMSSVSIEPAGLGVTYHLIDDIAKTYSLPLNHTDVELMSHKGGGWHNETFESMCENTGGGFERLGVLRMDVDNLGHLFQQGLCDITLENYKQLSNKLDGFFGEERLRNLCGEVSRDRLFIVYAGGDDLFIVGDWRCVIEAAQRIRMEFMAFAKEQLSPLVVDDYVFGLSGGVALVNVNYPLISGAERSAQEEGLAKGHECAQHSKNSFSIMGTPLNWDLELPAVVTLKDRLVGMLCSGRLPKSFLNMVMVYHAQAQIRNHQVGKNSIYWHLAYDCQRIKERNKGDDIQALADSLNKEVEQPSGTLGGERITTDYHPLELWALACRWAELEYRVKNED